jgi:hypothetical protein
MHVHLIYIDRALEWRSIGACVFWFGLFQVSGRHTYRIAGRYPITISVLDVGGSTTTIRSLAVVWGF